MKINIKLLVFFAVLGIILLSCSKNAKNACDNINCDDNNLCTVDKCNRENGKCSYQSINCGNEQICNKTTGKCEIIDKCKGVICDDKNPCTIENCNATTGACEFQKKICPSEAECDIITGNCFIKNIKVNENNHAEAVYDNNTKLMTESAMKALSETCDKKNFKVAFILLTENSADKKDLEGIDKIKIRVSDDFRYATENLGSIDTSYPTVVMKYDSAVFDMSTGFFNGANLSKNFYQSNPDQFDFIAVYHDAKIFGNINFDKIIYPLEGTQNKADFKGEVPDKTEDPRAFIDYYDQSRYFGSKHKLMGMLRLGSIKDRFEGIETEENIIRGRSSGFLHELGHFWCCMVGDYYDLENGKLRIIDHLSHWNPYFDHGPDPMAIHSSRTYWKEEGSDTFSSSTDFEKNRVKYHPFILYFMGFKNANQIREKFKVIKPEGNEWFDEDNKKVFVKGSVDYVTITDVIDVAGPRVCRFE